VLKKLFQVNQSFCVKQVCSSTPWQVRGVKAVPACPLVDIIEKPHTCFACMSQEDDKIIHGDKTKILYIIPPSRRFDRALEGRIWYFRTPEK
jgi:hypothetical protein